MKYPLLAHFPKAFTVFCAVCLSPLWSVAKPSPKEALIEPKVLGEYTIASVWDLALSPNGMLLYLTNPSGGKIQMVDLQTLQLSTVPGDFREPMGLAINPTNEGLYFTDPGLVSVDSLNDGQIRSILKGVKGSDLAFGPRYKDLYIVAGAKAGGKNNYNRIIKVSVKEGKVTSKVFIGPEYLDDPTRIAIDREEHDLYWYDEGTDAIVQSDLDGNNIIPIHYVYGTITGFVYDADLDLAYYSVCEGGKIYRLDRKTGKEVILAKDLKEPRGIAVDKKKKKLYTFETYSNTCTSEPTFWGRLKDDVLSLFAVQENTPSDALKKARLLEFDLQ
jgi:DNA-binding beta-propeller fold protein YncE